MQGVANPKRKQLQTVRFLGPVYPHPTSKSIQKPSWVRKIEAGHIQIPEVQRWTPGKTHFVCVQDKD